MLKFNGKVIKEGRYENSRIFSFLSLRADPIISKKEQRQQSSIDEKSIHFILLIISTKRFSAFLPFSNPTIPTR